MSKALNYIHDSLPGNTPLEEKCQRYAVLLSMSATLGVPYELSVSKLIMLDGYSLNLQYQKIDADDMSSFYMSAIDRYRITQLAPPFLEIIECLRMIDKPFVKVYLSNDELKIIVDLYKMVLGMPVTMVNLSGADLRTFHPSFQKTLRQLFQGHLNFDHTDDLPEPRHNSRWRMINFADQNELNSLGLLDDKQLAAEWQRQQRAIRQRRYREKHVHRRREWSRLTQQRLRLLNPDEARGQSTRRQQIRRDRLKRLTEESYYQQPFSGEDPPDQSSRAMRNLRRRQRRQQVREQRRKDHEMQQQRPLEERRVFSESTHQGLEPRRSDVQESQLQYEDLSVLLHGPALMPERIELQQLRQDRPVMPLDNRMTSSNHPPQSTGFYPPSINQILSNEGGQDHNQNKND